MASAGGLAKSRGSTLIVSLLRESWRVGREERDQGIYQWIELRGAEREGMAHLLYTISEHLESCSSGGFEAR